MSGLRFGDQLTSEANEIFEVSKYLGKNAACCQDEVAFRLKSVDQANKEIITTCKVLTDGRLELTDFKKFTPRPKFPES